MVGRSSGDANVSHELLVSARTPCREARELPLSKELTKRWAKVPRRSHKATKPVHRQQHELPVLYPEATQLES